MQDLNRQSRAVKRKLAPEADTEPEAAVGDEGGTAAAGEAAAEAPAGSNPVANPVTKAKKRKAAAQRWAACTCTKGMHST